jgi:hypothetical protein
LRIVAEVTGRPTLGVACFRASNRSRALRITTWRHLANLLPDESASLAQIKMMRAIDAIGAAVAPALHVAAGPN